jgi:hypothetical protein
MERLEAAPARDQINDQNHHGYDEYQMDELAAKMADEAEKPENQQNNKDSPEHKVSFGLKFLLLRVRRPPCAYGFWSIGQIFDNPTAFTQIRTNRWRSELKNITNGFRLFTSQILLSMRSKLLASCLVAMLLASHAFGCAFEGTIVEKPSWLRPDTSMIGTEGVYSFVFRGPTGTSRPPIGVPIPQFWTESSGSYKFLLRDQQGNVRSQLVTAEVFARCRVGDYFNDRGPACAPSDAKDSKATVGVIQQRRHHRMAQAGRSHRKVAQARRSHRKVATHRRHQSSKSRKMVTLHTAGAAVPRG